MKTYLLQLSPSVLFIGLILLVSQGCKDDNNNNDPANYRLTGLLMFDRNAIVDSATYIYQGDRLSECVDYSDNYQDPVHAFYNYPTENSIVVTSFNDTQKYEYTYNDGQMTEMLSSSLNNNIWEPLQKNTYQYQDGKLVEEIWYFDSDEGLKPEQKFTYEFDGNKVIRSKHYYTIDSTWLEYFKEEAIYTGNQITKINAYAYSDSIYIDYYHIDLQYNGTLLTGYFGHFSNGNELEFSYNYTYDSHGNMVIQEYPEQNMRIEYVFEEGKGNFRQIQQPGGGISGFVPLPWPTK